MVHDLCALSVGNIFCYIETVREPTDCTSKALRIHVGAGSIQYDSRLYDRVSGRVPSEAQRSYDAHSGVSTGEIRVLHLDTASPQLSLDTVVQERLSNIAFWYRISSKCGTMTFSPTTLEARLVAACEYRLWSGGSCPDPHKWKFVLRNSEHLTVYGEGVVASKETRSLEHFVLRPLRSNTLGHCAAVACSVNAIALITDDNELLLFAKYWATMRAEREIDRKAGCELGRRKKKSFPSGPFPYYELIF